MLPLAFALIALLFKESVAQYATEGFRHDKLVVCYVATWAVYRPENGKFDIRDIDPNLCTHAVYAFASLNATTNSIMIHDPHRDITLKGYQELVNLKEKNPKLKTLIAIGGWVEGALKYSWMADGRTNRTSFINSVVEFLSVHKFDGLDLDWEYPAAAERQGRPQDKENFAALVRELYEAFQPRGWLLTAAIGSSPRVIEQAYDIPILTKYLNIINVMCYDYHGNWEKQTGHNAPLYSRPDESLSDQKLNVNKTLRLLLNLGAHPSKLALGLPFYGHTFTLADSSQWNPGGSSEAEGGRVGPYSNQTGFMGYNEFCEMNLREKWTMTTDKFQKVPFAYKDKDWFSYDDEQSLKLKVEFAMRLQLGGVMIWSIESDDFKNVCQKGRYPLLTAVNQALMDDANEVKTIEESMTKAPKTENAAFHADPFHYTLMFIILLIRSV